MLTVILIMAAGMIVGHFLRNQKKTLLILNKSTLWIIFILLFFMGISVGANNEVMLNLDTIGLRGLELALVALLGSVILSWLVYIFVFKSNSSAHEG